jgi:hypothetical protein
MHALADCLHDYSEIIRVLEASLYLDLQQFIAFKGVGIDWIAILLKRETFPLILSTLRIWSSLPLARVSCWSGTPRP